MKNCIVILSAFALMACGCVKTPDIQIGTIPSVEGLETEVSMSAVPSGQKGTKAWQIEATAVNNTSEPQVFKLVLSAEPHIKADHYLIPGVLYNGNQFVGDFILSDGRSFASATESPGYSRATAAPSPPAPSVTIKTRHSACSHQMPT